MLATTPNRITALCEPELYPIEVIDGHKSRRKVSPGYWPRQNPADHLPLLVQVTVTTPAKVRMCVYVRLRLAGDYIIASASPCDRHRGEDFEASGAFPLASELEAEKIVLENL